WTKLSGPSSILIEKSNGTKTWLKGLAQGKYVIQLTVTDNNNATSSKLITVTVNAQKVNASPVASISGPESIFLPQDSVRLDGGASRDPDGTIRSYNWTQISGPKTGEIA